MMKILAIIFVLLNSMFVFCVRYEEGEPRYSSKGKLEELKGKQSVYLWCDDEDQAKLMSRILKNEAPQLKIVESAEECEIVLWCQLPRGAIMKTSMSDQNYTRVTGGVYLRTSDGQYRKLHSWIKDNLGVLVSGPESLPVAKIVREFIKNWEKTNR